MSQGMRLIHSNRPEVLRDFLVGWIRRHPRDGLEDETILVQSNGVAQWLKLGLAQDPGADGSGGLGIASCLDLSLPSRFVWQAYRAVLGADAVPDTSAFDKERLVWRLMRLLGALPEQSVYLPLLRFLGPGRDPMRCYQLAQQIADLFDQYQVYRADWLNAWEEGRDALIQSDRTQTALTAPDLWQPALWRDLHRDVGPEGRTSRASVHQAFLKKVYDAEQRLAGVPSRLFVFGVSALPRQSLEVLQAIAKCSEVFVCVHNPCREDWSGITHPLLVSWGKQGRDYMGLLQATEEPRANDRFGQPAQRTDLFERPGSDCLLHQLQDDLLQGDLLQGEADPTPHPEPDLDSGHDVRVVHDAHAAKSGTTLRRLPRIIQPYTDRSIVFHQSHSLQRELEVLHDQLLDAFDRDSTLQPRDIVVMVPDINAYAPVIEAVFGQPDADDPRRIPFSITDRVLSQQLPMAQALDYLLELTDVRCTVSELITLLGVPAVRQRIGLPEQQLPLLLRWIRESNIRWALDAEHRAESCGNSVDQNTWAFGLERMLLGYAVGNSLPVTSETPLWQGISPYGEVAGIDASCVGALAMLIASLRRYRAQFAVSASPVAWASRLEQMLGAFFAPQSTDEKAFLLQAQTTLFDWQQDCSQAEFEAPIPLSVVRSEWQARIAQQQFGQRFFAGRVSFATLMPMRAIPFRIVCLLGLNDGEFPRSRPRADFDLMRHDHRPGDRSRRDDDRYLFLEALVSARDRLYISWLGKSPVDNADRPPSVLVGQLRDHIDDGWVIDPCLPMAQAKVSSALTQVHRLQPFHPAYFPAPDSPGSQHWFTYSREWGGKGAGSTSAAAARFGVLAEPGVLLDPRSWAGQTLPLPSDQETGALPQVRLADLAAFLKAPVEVFFKERLKVYFGEVESLGQDDEEPFGVTALNRFTQEQALVDACYQALDQGLSVETALARVVASMRAGGDLPVGAARDLWMEEAVTGVEALFARYQALRSVYAGPPRQLMMLRDPIDQCFCLASEGRRIVVSPRRLRTKQGRLAFEKLVGFWVEHLALQVASLQESDIAMTTQILAMDGDVCFAPLDGARAQQLLDEVSVAYREALTRPLPLAPKAGFAWIVASADKAPGARTERDPMRVVRETYEGHAFSDPPALGEVGYSPYLMRAYPTFDALVQDGSFFSLCTRLYAPIKELAQPISGQPTKPGQADAA